MRAYSYIVKNDGGFAPNPFHGVCTLACCKPKIRQAAAVGDLVIGMSARAERLVYAMRVDRVLEFDAYWNDRRYHAKRAAWRSSRAIDRAGDNIYKPRGRDAFEQRASHHSNPDGTESARRKRKDLSGRHVLIGTRFSYHGGGGHHDDPARWRAVAGGVELRNVARGQEFVLDGDHYPEATRWIADVVALA